jgi:hypothetical protein
LERDVVSGLSLTADEIDVVVSALWDYKLETQQYLLGYGDEDAHDACCKTSELRTVRRRKQKDSLEERLRVTESAIAKLDPR